MFLLLGILIVAFGLIFLQITPPRRTPSWQDIVGLVLLIVGAISVTWSLGEFVFRIVPRFFI